MRSWIVLRECVFSMYWAHFPPHQAPLPLMPAPVFLLPSSTFQTLPPFPTCSNRRLSGALPGAPHVFSAWGSMNSNFTLGTEASIDLGNTSQKKNYLKLFHAEGSYTDPQFHKWGNKSCTTQSSGQSGHFVCYFSTASWEVCLCSHQSSSSFPLHSSTLMSYEQ